MKKILMIIGSVRETRKGVKISKWAMSKNVNKDINLVIADLVDMNLPHYNEPGSPRRNTDYKYEETRNWSELVASADGFIFVTPEYNGYFTGAMKDAIDYLYHEWENKPFGIIGYGSKGASRAAIHLETLLTDAFKMVKISPDIKINKVWDAFKGDEVNEEYIEGHVAEMMNRF